MNLQKNARHIITSSFIVNNGNLNHQSALSTCKILSTITSLNDEAIVAVLGRLDFSRIMLEHFYLDFLESAFLNDVITFRSYIHTYADNVVEISITGSKKQGGREVPIVNGSFVFAVKSGIEVHYSLS